MPPASIVSSEGCGRPRWEVTSSSPLVVISLRLKYQDLRGFLRSLESFEISMSQVHLTSADVNGLPSCHLTPWRNLKLRTLLSPLQAQLSARSGTMVSGLFCATSCL